jgi:outer membrane receptor protein involved in Fe transport
MIHAVLVSLVLAAPSLHGVVRDATGAAVEGAAVRLEGPGRPAAQVATGPDGAFAFEDGVFGPGRIVVEAAGFARLEHAVAAAEPGPLVLVLVPSPRAETLTVTASRIETRLADHPSRVVVLTAEDLEASASLTTDDALRQVPGFSLFRRTGSRAANPTAQGASLRGTGPSGASRAVVMVDGLPLNDTFGGWVYWSRVPREAVERIEVLEGGASDLYGSSALGGVVQVVTRTEGSGIAASASGGSQGTADASFVALGRRGAWSARVAGDALATDGYVLVDEAERGPVDTEAGARHLLGEARLERRLSSTASVFAAGHALGESRTNGTPLQVNDTDFQQGVFGLDARVGAGALSVRSFYGTQRYYQTFSAVAAGRASETLTRTQDVPATGAGLGLQWSRALGGRHALVLGAEWRLARGQSDETVFTRGVATSLQSAGGRQRTRAAYALGRFALGPRVDLGLGARVDAWTNDEGRQTTTPLGPGSAATTTVLADRDDTEVSPRASLLVRAHPRLRLTVAAYSAFRAPTLNELHRSFRVGDTVTLANAALAAERLRGAEAGLAYVAADGRFSARALGFWSRIDDPVANVTRSSTPGLITRQRQNLGETRSAGVEIDGEVAVPARGFRVRAGYAFVDAVVTAFPPDPFLVGNAVPQVSTHQGTLQVQYDGLRGYAFAVMARASSRAFEDDQNRLPLAGYATLDLRAARRLGAASIFVAAENLTGARYEVGRTPIPTVGPPRLLRAGISFDWRP